MNKKFITLLTTSVMTLTSLATPIAVNAQDLDSQIQSANAKVASLTSEISTIETELTTLSADIASAEAQATQIQQTIIDAQNKINTLKTEITLLEELIAKRTEKLKEQAQAEQTENNFGNYINILLNSESFVDAIERFNAISDLVSAGKEMLDQQVSDKQAVDNKRLEAEQELTLQAERAKELSELQSSLTTKKANREVYVASLAAEKATTEEERNTLLTQKAEAERIAKELAEQEAARAAAIANAKTAKVKIASNAQTAINVIETATNATSPTATVSESSGTTIAPTQTAPAEVTTPVTTPVTTEPATTTAAAPVSTNSGVGAAIASAALAQIGVFQDCTMLVTNALRAVGINFHGWPAGYLSLGTIVSAAEAQPGDLVYYADGGLGLAHIGVYIGNGQAVHGGWGYNQTAVATAYLGSGPVFIRVNK